MKFFFLMCANIIADEAQPNATMETRVAGQGQPKRVGRWTLAQLRQTDGNLFLLSTFT